MNVKKVTVPAINCGHCVATIKREIGELDGVTSVTGDPKTKEVTVEWAAPAEWETIAATLSEIGYPVKE